jgi:hypothetical protein
MGAQTSSLTRWLPALGAILGLTFSSRVHANPLDTFGFGSRESAMGSAVSADDSDFTASYYNPAGLALARSLEVSVGYFRADHFLYMNGNRTQVEPVKGIVGGAVVPGRLFGVPFTFGLAVHVPDDGLLRVNALPQTQPRWELYDNNERLYFTVNAAISPFKWLQIGGGITYMAGAIATLDIGGYVDITQTFDSTLRHQVDADIKIVQYPEFGVRIEPSKELSFAAVYRGQFALNLNVAANVNAGVGVGQSGLLTTLMLAMQSMTVDAFLPQQVVVGGSYKPTDSLHLNLDLTWVNWSAYEPPVTALDVQLNVPPPKGGWPAGIMPPSVPAPVTVIPIVMHDTIVPHVGAEWRAIARRKWEGFVRGGYEYFKSPIAAQSGVTNYVDRDRHALSLGAGLRLLRPGEVLRGDVRFDVHGQLSLLPSSTTQKTDPADPVGDYTAGGHIWVFGGAMTAGF